MSDLNTRQQALEPASSFIVQAPAGSGKTALLVYRFLTALSAVERPEQILAITFTRKATAEMRGRLLELLEKAEAGEHADDAFEQQGIDLAAKVLNRDRQQGWQLLDSPDQLQIFTIDAYCARISASMPWLSRMGNRPSTTDDASHLYSAAINQLLAGLVDQQQDELHPALCEVMQELQFDYARTRKLLAGMLQKRDQWLRHLVSGELDQLRAEFNQSWASLERQACSGLAKHLSEPILQELIELANDAAARVPKDKPALQNFASLPIRRTDQLSGAHWRDLVSLLTVEKGRKIRSPRSVNKNIGFPPEAKDSKQKLQALLQDLQHENELTEAAQELISLPEAPYDDDDWSQLLALQKVLLRLAALLQLEFRRAGECDHSEVSQRALMALNELDAPTDLALRMDYQLEHILVDEFQDTSRTQLELLRQLTAGWQFDDGRSLFLVGDPMQSIYRFREADVSLFLQVVENDQTGVFGNLQITPLTLTQNFRSRSNLVEWFNQVFRVSFPSSNDVLKGAIKYAPSTSDKPDDGMVRLQLVADEQQEAEFVVAEVQRELAENSDSKIAILVSSRSHLANILPALEQANIEFAGVDINPLAQLGEVQDLLTLTKALCRQNSRLDWLALLRSPLVGLSLKQLEELTSGPSQTVWTALQIADFDFHTQVRLARFISVMSEALSQHQHVKLHRLVRWTWRSLGGPQTGNQLTDIDFHRVLSIIEQQEQGGDLVSIKQLDDAIASLYAQPADQATARVQVSTIHKAKGLQYDTVILPGLDRKTRPDDKSVLMWAERNNDSGGTQLLIAPIRMQENAGQHFDYLRRLESQRSEAERVRVMYVACTRAERQIILLGKHKLDDDGAVKTPIRSSLLATVWDTLSEQFSISSQDSSEPETDRMVDQSLQRLPFDWTLATQRSVDWQAPVNQSEQDRELEFDWATPLAAGVGSVLHNWIEANSTRLFELEISSAQKSKWRSQLAAYGVAPERLQAGVNRLADAVTGMQRDEHARFIFGDQQDASNELSLTRFKDSKLETFSLDRTFIDDAGTRWVVDYKTTTTQRKDIKRFVEEQVNQRHKPQLENYGSLMAELDDRPIKLAVYFPLLQIMHTWDYSPT